MKDETMNIICEVFFFSFVDIYIFYSPGQGGWDHNDVHLAGVWNFFFCFVAQLFKLWRYPMSQWLIESFVLCAIFSFFAISFDIMRTHAHPIVVSLPACIYWNSYRTWRWVGSRWVLQYLQATASPAAILRLIGGHRPFLFASTLFGFSIHLPSSWSTIFILRHCRCQKILPEKK